jgi:uncharacterized RDD family membrane protein YckC
MPTPQTKVVARRTFGFLIDLVLWWAISFALFFALAKHGLPELGPDGKKVDPYFNVTANGDTWFVQSGTAWLWLGLCALVLLGLAVLLQSLTGATPGKLLVGVRVVGADGQRAGAGRNLVRLLGWSVDGLPWIFLFGLSGFVTTLNAKGNRRVGDMWAGTYVVRASAVGQPVVDGAGIVIGATATATATAGGDGGDGGARDAFGNPVVPRGAAGTAGGPVAASASPAPTSSAPGAPAPDWYPDPTGAARLRYWDGRAWTHHVAP